MADIPLLTEYVEVAFPVTDRPACDGMRVDAFLTERLRAHSREYVRKYIESGRVFLRGKPVKPSTKVTLQDVVIVRYPPRREPQPDHAALEILHEDEAILAVNKPGGVLSHPAGKVVKNAATSILARQFPGMSLHLAHRLDRETSGLLLFAKSPGDAKRLAGSFQRREVDKRYLAVVFGKAAFSSTVVDAPLACEGKGIRVRQAVDFKRGQGARTEFKTLAVSSGFSLLEASPATGRLHQIRVHAAALGHPLVGDKLYLGDGKYFLKAVDGELSEGDFSVLGARRQMLHAWKASFRHPAGGERLQLRAPAPADFSACLCACGLAGR